MVETWSYGSGKKIHGVSEMGGECTTETQKVRQKWLFSEIFHRLVHGNTVPPLWFRGFMDPMFRCTVERINGLLGAFAERKIL